MRRGRSSGVTRTARLAVSKDRRQEAERFIAEEAGDFDIVAITESRDQLASSVTVWYRTRG